MSITRPLTKKEAADYLRMTERSIDRYRAAGLIRAVKGRGKVLFRQEELDRYLKDELQSAR